MLKNINRDKNNEKEVVEGEVDAYILSEQIKRTIIFQKIKFQILLQKSVIDGKSD